MGVCNAHIRASLVLLAHKGLSSGSLLGNVRAQRAVDRAHNEAVIASTDEQVAQALADEEAQVSRQTMIVSHWQ